MKVGIPQALHYYQYYPMWHTFFTELGAEVVVSPPTGAQMVNAGLARLSAEVCLPVRVYCGHALTLAGKCDYIFIPSVHSVEPVVYNCPKLIGLPDLIRAVAPECQPLLDPHIDINQGKLNLYKTVYRLGRVFNYNPWQVKRAAERALKVHRHYLTQMAIDQRTMPQAMASLFGQPPLQAEDTARSNLTIALIGHPYLLHDRRLNHEIIAKLRNLGVTIRMPEMVHESDRQAALLQLVERAYWTSEAQFIGAGSYYVQSDVDGLISLTAFGCGPDSLMLELLRRQAKKLGKPFLSLLFDEHTADAGLVTRLEAFVDMIRRRRSSPVVSLAGIKNTGEMASRRAGKLGLVTFGNLAAGLKGVAGVLDIPVVAPPVTRQSLLLGTQYSPEFACIPFKLILGNFIQTLEDGADTLLMVTSTNACRLGYYAKVHEQILREIGYEFRFLKFGSEEKGLLGVMKAMRRIANGASWSTIVAAFRLGTAKLRALDDIERQVQKYRPIEVNKGSSDAVFKRAITTIDETQDLKVLRNIVREHLQELDNIPKDTGIKPLRVGIIGEIYAVIEPFVNMNVEKELGKLGVEVRRTRSTYFSELARLGSFNVLNQEKRKLGHFARPYMKRDVGGHGLESLAEKVHLAREGYDGIVHLAPFTCMPEAIAQNIMPTTVENIPVLSVICDEQIAEAGFITRLEAFVDLLKRRDNIRNTT